MIHDEINSDTGFDDQEKRIKADDDVQFFYP